MVQVFKIKPHKLSQKMHWDEARGNESENTCTTNFHFNQLIFVSSLQKCKILVLIYVHIKIIGPIDSGSSDTTGSVISDSQFLVCY